MLFIEWFLLFSSQMMIKESYLGDFGKRRWWFLNGISKKTETEFFHDISQNEGGNGC
jgi:hypothetical protein